LCLNPPPLAEDPERFYRSGENWRRIFLPRKPRGQLLRRGQRPAAQPDLDDPDPGHGDQEAPDMELLGPILPKLEEIKQ